jgi:DNA-binding NtrC family response regulator
MPPIRHVYVCKREPAASGAFLPGEAIEKSYVEQALKQASNNKLKAARLLGLTRAQLYLLLEKYGL